MGTDSALSYYFFNHSNNKNESIVVSTIFFWQLFWGAFCIAIFIFIKPYINVYFLKSNF